MNIDRDDSAIAQAARVSPAAWATYASGGRWKLAPHLKLIDSLLVDAIVNGNRRLAISLCPRHGKSSLISRYATSWAIGTNPWRKVLLASYGSNFAETWGMKARDALSEHGEKLFGVRINKEIASRNSWQVEAFNGKDWERTDGGMWTAGVGAGLTGLGSDLAIVDDPLKDWNEARSKSHLDSVWDWFRAVLLTRVEPNGSVCVVMTRWSEVDVIGRLEAGQDGSDQERWTIINLPALAMENDLLGRNEGEALWPERYPAHVLEDIRQAVGPIVFACLYQQQPMVEGGTVFKREHFRYWRRFGDEAVLYAGDTVVKRHHLPFLRRQIYIDPALSERQSADPTAALVCAVTPDHEVLVLDVVTERIEGPKVKQLIRDLQIRHDPVRIGVESVAYQKSIVQDLIQEGLPVIGIKTDADKYSRAVAAATRMSQGNVYFEADAPWLAGFENELLMFPNAAHDDRCDVLAHAISDILAGGKALLPVMRRVPYTSDGNILRVAW